MSRMVGPMIEALKNQRTLQGFCCGCEGRINGRDREIQEALGFWMSSLEIGNFRGSKVAMLQLFETRIFLWPWLGESHKILQERRVFCRLL